MLTTPDSLTRIEKVTAIAFAAFLTSQVYKQMVEDYVGITADVTLVYGLVTVVGAAVLLRRQGALLQFQISTFGWVFMGLYFLPILYLAGADFSDDYTMTKITGFLTFTALATFFPVAYFVSAARVEYFIRALLIVGSVSALIPSVEAYATGALQTANVRVEGFGANVILISRVSAMCALIAFLLFRQRDGGTRRFLYLALALTMTVAAMITASRGPLLALLVLVVFFSHNNQSKLHGFAMKVVNVAGLVAFFLLAQPLLNQILPEASQEKVVNTESDSRVELAIESMVLIAKNPIGVGFGQYKANTSLSSLLTDSLRYPHNLMIEYAIETGLVGGLLYVLVLIKAFAQHRPRSSLPDSYTHLHLLFLFALFQSMVSGDMNTNRLLFCFLPMVLMKPYIYNRLPFSTNSVDYLSPQANFDIANRLRASGLHFKAANRHPE